ncbi:hypothetical protein V8F20_009389 [Naviculisporaceae sp. PSN 640]
MVSLRYLVTAAVAVAAPLVSALPTRELLPSAKAITASKIVENIQALTAKSQALQKTANNITIQNGPLIIIGQGPFPKIIAGLQDIALNGTNAFLELNGTPHIGSKDEAASVADAFREFVRVHQAFLNILIGKASLFNSVGIIREPVANELRQVERVIDTFAFTLIDTIDPIQQKKQIQEDLSSLDSTLDAAINAYSG